MNNNGQNNNEYILNNGSYVENISYDIIKIFEMVNDSEKKYSFDEILKSTDVNKAGVIYYLSKYLKGVEPDKSFVDYTQKQVALEKEFLVSVLPYISKQTIDYMSQSEMFAINERDKAIDIHDAGNIGLEATTNILAHPELKYIIDRLAAISMKKIANKQPITKKEEGYILYRIALNEGDFLDRKNYNILYLQLFHELSQNQNIGIFAEQYLNKMFKNTAIGMQYFSDDFEEHSMRRK